MKPPASRHPGIAKTKRARLFQPRTLRLVASSDARWGEIFETADVVSEGAQRGEAGDRSYFGSSNIILLIAPEVHGQTPEFLAGAVAKDPHVRLRAMRVARREAEQRANGPLDKVRTEITVTPCATGVAVHVEVEAVVLRDRRTSTRAERAAGESVVPAVSNSTNAAIASALVTEETPIT
ncbi:MAG: hypothetical protein ABW133_17065 [Polyangiaceae bacterium]